jgi:hypothetical protein
MLMEEVLPCHTDSSWKYALHEAVSQHAVVINCEGVQFRLNELGKVKGLNEISSW